MRVHRAGVRCAATGCDKPVRGWHSHCNTHHHHTIRHGHPDQTPILRSHLRPYKDRLERWYKTPSGANALSAVITEYDQLVDEHEREDLKARLEVERTGIDHRTWPRQASRLIAQAAPQRDTRTAVLELMSLGMMLEEDERTFRNDQAFRCAVVNAFLRGTTAGTRRVFRATHGKPVAATRYLKRQVVDALSDVLMKATVVHGVLLAREWNAKARREKEAKQKVADAIKASVDDRVGSK